MANEGVNVPIDGNPTGFRRAMQEVIQSAKDGKNGIESQFGSLGTVFRGVQNHIAAIGAAFAGVGMAGFIKQSIDAADNLNDLSQRMGVSVELLSGLRLAADQSGTSLETVAKASKKLSVNMGDAASGNKEMSKLLDSLGISGKNTTEAMVKMADIFSKMPDGWLKSALAAKLFGKAGEEMIPMLNGGSAALLKQIELGEKFSGVTGEMGHQADQFNDDLAVLKLSLSGVWMRIGQDLLPILNSLMGDMQKTAEKTRNLSTEFNPLKETLRALIVVGGNVAFVFNGIGREIGGIAAQMVALATGNFSGFSAIGKAMKEDAIAARKEFDEWEKRMMSPNFGIPATSPSGGGGGDGSGDTEARVCSAMGGRWNAKTKKCESGAAATTNKAQAPDSYMQYYEAALDQEKRLAFERDAVRGYSKEQELAFWQMLIANADLKGKDRLAIERKVSGLIIDIKRTEAKQKQEIDSENARSGEVLALGRVDAERAAAQVSLDLGLMSKSQFLVIEEQHEQQRFEIQRAALEERLKLLEKDPNTNPVEFARLKNQILELEQQHELKRMQLRGQAQQEDMQVWGNLANRMGGLWNKGMQAMLNGTLTWRNAIKAIGAEMVAWFAMDVVGAQVKAWIAGEAMKIAKKLGFFAAEKAMTLAEIPALAGLAGAGGVASMAAAPFPVNMGAPAFGAAMMMAAMAYAPMASAAGGYDIPRGINPLTQLHAEEMVLPSDYANVIRGLAEGGASSGGGGDVHIYSRNDKDVVRVSDLKDLLRQMNRNFVTVKK